MAIHRIFTTIMDQVSNMNPQLPAQLSLTPMSEINLNDFHGVYHRSKIAHPFPVPGTVLTQEKKRRDHQDKRMGLMIKEVKKIEKKHMKVSARGVSATLSPYLLTLSPPPPPLISQIAKGKERKQRLNSNIEFQARVGDLLRRVEGTIDKAAEVVADKKVEKALNKPKGEFQSEEDKEKAKEKKKMLKEAAGDDDSSHFYLPSTQQTINSQSSQFVPQYVPSFWRLVHSGKATHVANYLSTGFPHIDAVEPKYGNTVLVSSIKKGDVDMVEVLLRYNASTSIPNEMGDGPIHMAWRFWDRAPLKTPIMLSENLEENRGQVHAKVLELEERAARRKEQEGKTTRILSLLLSHGASPNMRDGSGSTALFDAARRGPIKAVKLLLQFGADCLMKNDSNQVALRVAKQQKQWEISKLLQHWPSLIDPHKKAEFLSEWKSFLDDVDIPIAIPSAPAKRVLDDLMIKEHQETLARWKRIGMPVVDEIVSGPLSVPLEAKVLLSKEKEKLLNEKKGRALKMKAKDEDHARVQRLLNEGKEEEKDLTLTDRERKFKRANELIAEKESNVAQRKRLPKHFNTLEVPLDFYLQGKVGGGFIERKGAAKKLSKAELIGVGAKRKKLEEEKKRLYRQTVSRVRKKNQYDHYGVGRDHELPPSTTDLRHKAAALQVKDDGSNLKVLARASTNSIIGVPLRREKTAEEVDLERRRREDVDKRIILRARMNQAEARAQFSAIESFKASDPSSKLREEALRRRDPAISGITRKQFCDDDLLPSLPPNPDVKHAKALLESGHKLEDLVDIMSLPSAQFEAMMNELEEQSLEAKEDIEQEMEDRGLVKYHISTHTAKAKAANSRLSRINRVVPEEPWSAIIDADFA